MKELFYFSKSNVMVQVQFSFQANALMFSSHRQLTDTERTIIEKYISENVATEAKNPSFENAPIQYNGVDFKLINHLNQFQAVKPFSDSDQQYSAEKNPFKSLLSKDVENSVKELIETSMSNYYFEKIGNAIVEVRNKIEGEVSETELREYREGLEELVEAYNEHASNKVDLREVLPKELIA